MVDEPGHQSGGRFRNSNSLRTAVVAVGASEPATDSRHAYYYANIFCFVKGVSAKDLARSLIRGGRLNVRMPLQADRDLGGLPEQPQCCVSYHALRTTCHRDVP